MQNGFQALYPTARQAGGGGDVSLTTGFAQCQPRASHAPQAPSLPVYVALWALGEATPLHAKEKNALFSSLRRKEANVVVGGKYDFRINYQLGNGSSLMRH